MLLLSFQVRKRLQWRWNGDVLIFMCFINCRRRTTKGITLVARTSEGHIDTGRAGQRAWEHKEDRVLHNRSDKCSDPSCWGGQTSQATTRWFGWSTQRVYHKREPLFCSNQRHRWGVLVVHLTGTTMASCTGKCLIAPDFDHKLYYCMKSAGIARTKSGC